MKLSLEELKGISQDIIKKYFEYENGNLIWTKFVGGRSKKGLVAGCINNRGRVNITFLGKMYQAHRLIWIYHNGFIPYQSQIDHIDRDPSNNKIENLRLSSGRENQMNRSDNTSGFPGVSWSKSRKKWVSSIKIKKKSICLGGYENIEDAVESRRKAEVMYGIFVKNDFYKRRKT